jgi:hypothetical protein
MTNLISVRHEHVHESSSLWDDISISDLLVNPAVRFSVQRVALKQKDLNVGECVI